MTPDDQHTPTRDLFCDGAPDNQRVGDSTNFYAVLDGYPVSPGHTLIIPRAHITDLFELPRTQLVELFELLRLAWLRLVHEHHPDGFNLGVNNGTAAGRTINHLHLHLIPRYRGDMPDPRGGVRNLMPDAPRPDTWDTGHSVGTHMRTQPVPRLRDLFDTVNRMTQLPEPAPDTRNPTQMPDDCEVGTEWEVRWYGTDDPDGIRLSQRHLQSRAQADNIAPTRLGEYGITRWSIHYRHHWSFGDGDQRCTFSGPTVRVADGPDA